jgi:hypothetical protein
MLDDWIYSSPPWVSTSVFVLGGIVLPRGRSHRSTWALARSNPAASFARIGQRGIAGVADRLGTGCGDSPAAPARGRSAGDHAGERRGSPRRACRGRPQGPRAKEHRQSVISSPTPIVLWQAGPRHLGGWGWEQAVHPRHRDAVQPKRAPMHGRTAPLDLDAGPDF